VSGVRRRDREDLRTALLDAAEHAFARRGYDGVGVREITEAAGCRVAAVTEVFGGKRELFRDVLLRRVGPLTDDRRARLEAGAPSLESVVRAFTEPMLDRAHQPGWPDYFRFVAQLSASALPEQVLVADEYGAIAAMFVERLQGLHPSAPWTRVIDAYLLMVSASLPLFAGPGRFEHVVGDAPHVPDLEARHEAMVRFLTGGIHAMLTEGT
jgi:AcrR family transcriptional regulator